VSRVLGEGGPTRPPDRNPAANPVAAQRRLETELARPFRGGLVCGPLCKPDLRGAPGTGERVRGSGGEPPYPVLCQGTAPLVHLVQAPRAEDGHACPGDALATSTARHLGAGPGFLSMSPALISSWTRWLALPGPVSKNPPGSWEQGWHVI
jgi:hypothetical protein